MHGSAYQTHGFEAHMLSVDYVGGLLDGFLGVVSSIATPELPHQKI
jgi:hypothetical protein